MVLLSVRLDLHSLIIVLRRTRTNTGAHECCRYEARQTSDETISDVQAQPPRNLEGGEGHPPGRVAGSSRLFEAWRLDQPDGGVWQGGFYVAILLCENTRQIEEGERRPVVACLEIIFKKPLKGPLTAMEDENTS